MTLDKIIEVSKRLRFEKRYRQEFKSSVPYASEIVRNKKYGEGYFLIMECMIFARDTVDDTEYCIYEFTLTGDYINQRDFKDNADLWNFLNTKESIKKITYE